VARIVIHNVKKVKWLGEALNNEKCEFLQPHETKYIRILTFHCIIPRRRTKRSFLKCLNYRSRGRRAAKEEKKRSTFHGSGVMEARAFVYGYITAYLRGIQHVSGL
jgi:hypothetical protein